MIIFKKFGETIEIRNDDWKRLRARYNPENAVWIKSKEVYKIRKKCPFCDFYYECEGCPFAVFDKYGCYEFFERVFPSGTEFDHDIVSEVAWGEDNDKGARKQLARLQRMMDKIEASQGRKDDTK